MKGGGGKKERGGGVFSIGSSGGWPCLALSAWLSGFFFILIQSALVEYLRWASLGELNTPDYGE